MIASARARGTRCERTQTTDGGLCSNACGTEHANREVADLEPLRQPAMHRGSEQPSSAKSDEGANAMCDGVATESDFGIAVVREQAAARVADTVERSAGNFWRRHDEQRALGASGTDVDTAATAGCVLDAKLGDFGAKQCEHRMRVVTGVFVDREDLEAELEVAQVLGGPLHGDTDCLLVVSKRQDDGDVEPRAFNHR